MRATERQLQDIKDAAAPLKGTPYELMYVTAPTETTLRWVFQHHVALSVHEALDTISAAKAKLADGSAEWSSGERYTPSAEDENIPATLEAVQAELGKLDIRSDIVTGAMDRSRALNIWAVQGGRYPSTSAYGPNAGSPTWSWGDEFQHTAARTASAETVARLIVETL